MDDNKLYKISITGAIIGLILILILSVLIEPERIEISKIGPEMVGKAVTIEGIVYNIQEKNGNRFFDLIDKGHKIPVVEFKFSDQMIDGQRAIIIGKIENYEGSLEIIAKEIKILY